jgi:hypothetical protein
LVELTIIIWLADITLVWLKVPFYFGWPAGECLVESDKSAKLFG